MSLQINIRNKRAKFEYEILDTYVAGMQLLGTEIKSIRNSKASIVESYCVFVKNELFVRNMNITEYKDASFKQHDPKRDRKLLLNRIELDKLKKKLETKGLAIVPIKVFMTEGGFAKMEIGLGQGKKLHDKREDLKQKDAKRDMDRALKR